MVFKDATAKQQLQLWCLFMCKDAVSFMPSAQLHAARYTKYPKAHCTPASPWCGTCEYNIPSPTNPIVDSPALDAVQILLSLATPE
jgi:hypothetical protein